MAFDRELYANVYDAYRKQSQISVVMIVMHNSIVGGVLFILLFRHLIIDLTLMFDERSCSDVINVRKTKVKLISYTPVLNIKCKKIRKKRKIYINMFLIY